MSEWVGQDPSILMRLMCAYQIFYSKPLQKYWSHLILTVYVTQTPKSPLCISYNYFLLLLLFETRVKNQII